MNFLSEDKKKTYYYYGGKEKKAGEIKKAPEEPEEELIPYFSKDLQRDFNRMMDRFQKEFENFWEQPPKMHYQRLMRHRPMMLKTVMPTMDLEDCGKDFRLTADLPGFNKENVDVEVTEDAVIVQAQQEQTAEEKKKNYVRHERAAQTYYRRIPLPEAVLSEEAKANLNNGILEIVLPKKTPKETKKLKID